MGRMSRLSEAVYEYAALQLEAAAKNGEVAALFRRSLELEPSLDKARLELGLLDAQDLQFAASLDLLPGLRTMPRCLRPASFASYSFSPWLWAQWSGALSLAGFPGMQAR